MLEKNAPWTEHQSSKSVLAELSIGRKLLIKVTLLKLQYLEHVCGTTCTDCIGRHYRQQKIPRKMTVDG